VITGIGIGIGIGKSFVKFTEKEKASDLWRS
jgi:hypothetical protein